MKQTGLITMRPTDSLVNGLLELIMFVGGKDFVMAEIGSYQGESTERFARSGNYKKIYAVDPWQNGYDDNPSHKQKASYACPMSIVEGNFDKRMEGLDIVKKMKMASVEAAAKIPDESLDFVYIDGCHKYESVKQDVMAWLPKIKPTGFIGGHDYSEKVKPDKPLKNNVKKALEETLGYPIRTFQDGSWVCRPHFGAIKVLWQQVSSPVITEILCQSEFTGIVFDMEHGSFNPESLCNSIRICKMNGKLPFVRFAELDKPMIRMALDNNCYGIIMSTVESAEQAKEFVDYCCYPPYGKRGRGLVSENKWGELPLICRNPVMIPQIETAIGVKNIEEIKNVYAFPYYLIGPYDLSASLGDVGNFKSEKFNKYMKIINKAIDKKRLGYHVVKDVEAQLKQFMGYGFLAVGMDTTMLLERVKALDSVTKGF